MVSSKKTLEREPLNSARNHLAGSISSMSGNLNSHFSRILYDHLAIVSSHNRTRMGWRGLGQVPGLPTCRGDLYNR